VALAGAKQDFDPSVGLPAVGVVGAVGVRVRHLRAGCAEALGCKLHRPQAVALNLLCNISVALRPAMPRGSWNGFLRLSLVTWPIYLGPTTTEEHHAFGAERLDQYRQSFK
jgi:hypothetical protein